MPNNTYSVISNQDDSKANKDVLFSMLDADQKPWVLSVAGSHGLPLSPAGIVPGYTLSCAMPHRGIASEMPTWERNVDDIGWNTYVQQIQRRAPGGATIHAGDFTLEHHGVYQKRFMR